MSKIKKKVILYPLFLASLLVLFIFFFIIFVPKSYDVTRLESKPKQTYWQLSTGSNIHYIKIPAEGHSKAMPIIYLHGGPGGRVTEVIINQLHPLTRVGYDLYFYDQIGSGYSDRLADINEYTVDRHYRDLAAIINTIGTEKVILIGQSWGALLLALYLTEHPEKVEKVILTGPGPMLPIRSELVTLEAPDSLHLRAPAFSNQEGNAQVYNLRMKVARWRALTFGKKWTSDQEADDFFTSLNTQLNKSAYCDPSKSRPSSAGGGYYSHLMTLNSFRQVKDQRDKTQQVQTPVLVMKGQCDNQPWGFTQEYLKVFPNAKLKVIPGAGHFIAEEEQELYLETIKAFLFESQ